MATCCFTDILSFAVYYILPALLLLYVLDYLWRKPLVGGRKDKYVLITGCDTGFGEMMAQRLDTEGICVFAGCLTEKGVQSLKERCSSRLTAFQLDVSSDESIQNAYKLVTDTLPNHKGLWGLINNAGVMSIFGPSEWHARQDYRDVMEVNAFGAFQMSIVFLPLIQRERGRLLITSSILGRFAMPWTSAYIVSKFASLGFTHSLRREQRVFGVDVISVQPGAHKTGLVSAEKARAGARKLWDNQPENVQAKYGQKYLKDVSENGLEMLEKSMTTDLSGVLDAYYHGLFARNPRADYVIGADAYLYILLSYLPHVFIDPLGSILGLVPAKLPQ